MISADVKYKTTRNKRYSGCIHSNYKLLDEVPSKLQIQCKKGVYFSFDFGWYSIHLDFVR